MLCPECGRENSNDCRFCQECGHQLSAAGSLSNATLDFDSPQSYTPRHLADRILSSRSALEGERKPVTVLFCDLVESTPLAERLGPELMHHLVHRFFEVGLDEVHRYDGTISQFMGDGFMALFGAPLASEDHARRAVLAALSIQDSLRGLREELRHEHDIQLSVRMGLNTGTVVIGRIGDNLRMDYTAVGDTSNLAARLQQLAEPDTILLSEATARLAGGVVDLIPEGPRTVKGKSRPVPVYRLVARRPVGSRFEVTVQRGLTRFVGRDGELQTLISAWEKVKGGQGCAVSLVGEAGIGKSRLLYEFKQYLAKEGVSCFEASCFAYGDVISYLPFLEFVKAFFDLRSTESGAETKRRIDQVLAALALDLSRTAPYLYNLLALSVDDEFFAKLPPNVIRQRTVEALKALVLSEANRRPLVLVFEDVHWVDKATEEVLGAIVEAMAPVPLLLILVYRPEYLHLWADRPDHARIYLSRLPAASSGEMVRAILTKPHVARVHVDRLSPEQSRAMLQELLGIAIIPLPLEQLIANKTDGNPFFVEELTRSLLESGDLLRMQGEYVLKRTVQALDIPTTVQGVLLTRIDRLHEEPKRVLQVASAIGRVFSRPLLEYALRTLPDTPVGGPDLERMLERLEDVELVFGLSSTHQQEYSFKHVLIQEAVYSTLLQHKREIYHEKIGQALESMYADRLEEYYELIAHHYFRSANSSKALEYLDLANQKAARRNAMIEANIYFDQAMRLLDNLPETEANARRRISVLVNQLLVVLMLYKIQEYYELLTRFHPLATNLGDSGLLEAFNSRVGFCDWAFGFFDRAIQTTQKAAEHCEAIGRFGDAGLAYLVWQWSHFYKGDFDQVLKLKEHVFRMMEREFELRWYTFALFGAAFAHTFLGQWNQAERAARDGLEIGETFSDNGVICFAAYTLSMIYTHVGDLTRAIKFGELAVEKAPTPLDKGWAQAFLAWARARNGEPLSAVEVLAPVVAIGRSARYRPNEILAPLLCEAYYLASEYGKAAAALDELLQIAEPSGMKYFVGFAHRLHADILRTTNADEAGVSRAASHYQDAITLLQQIGAPRELALALAGYGQLQKLTGLGAEAGRTLGEAIEIFDRLGIVQESSRARDLLDQLPAQ